MIFKNVIIKNKSERGIFLIKFKSNCLKFILIPLIAFIIPVFIWICLYLEFEKGYEQSWAIGVGLFGSISGGICTLIAVIISTMETRKIQDENKEFNKRQLKIILINDQINEYKNLKDILDKFYQKLKNSKNNIEIYALKKEIDSFTKVIIDNSINDDLINDIDNIIMNLLCMDDRNTAIHIESRLCIFKEKLSEILLNENIHINIYTKYAKDLQFFLEETEKIRIILKDKIWILYNEKYKLPDLDN